MTYKTFSQRRRDYYAQALPLHKGERTEVLDEKQQKQVRTVTQSNIEPSPVSTNIGEVDHVIGMGEKRLGNSSHKNQLDNVTVGNKPNDAYENIAAGNNMGRTESESLLTQNITETYSNANYRTTGHNNPLVSMRVNKPNNLKDPNVNPSLSATNGGFLGKLRILLTGANNPNLPLQGVKVIQNVGGTNFSDQPDKLSASAPPVASPLPDWMP